MVLKNKNVRTYSPSMARCCPPLAAAHPRVSSLPLFILLSRNTQTHSHSLSICSHFPNLPLSSSGSLSLHLDVVSVYQDRLEVAAAIFRWQHPPSLLPSLPPSLSLLFPLSFYLPCASTSALIIDSVVALGGPSGLSMEPRRCKLLKMRTEVLLYALAWMVNERLGKPSMTSGWSPDNYRKFSLHVQFKL